MPYNPLFHNRHSIRLQGYDYSSEGAYFLTICTYQHQHMFGNIDEGVMYLNQYGQIVHDEWEKSAIIRAEIELGEYVIMPNHMHAIVFIVDDPRRGVRPNAPTTNANTTNTNTKNTNTKNTNMMNVNMMNVNMMNVNTTYGKTNSENKPSGLQSKSIGSLISGFKSSVTKQINLIRNTPGEPVWQRNYWDHIIRNDESFDKIEDYIINNPLNWHQDQLFTPYGRSAERPYDECPYDIRPYNECPYDERPYDERPYDIRHKSYILDPINPVRNSPGKHVWQQNYWEHIFGTFIKYASSLVSKLDKRSLK
jgi:REP element-mobilizing transposase RayT